MDPAIRPANSLLLMALQSAEGTYATPSALTDVVPCEVDSIDYNGPYKSETVDEANGSYASGAPMVVGQPATVSFRARLKGANATYTASVKPPLHAALSACGWLGQFTAAIAAAALGAGTATSATLGTGFAATAQTYRGMPLILAGAPAAGYASLVSDYSAAKVATVVDQFGTALSATNTAALPANWTYAPTSPSDASSRTTMHPCGTIALYEDGVLHRWGDCRGTFDADGDAGKPGFGTFSFTGIYLGPTDAATPTTIVYPGQSAPLLAVGPGGVGTVFQLNRRGLPISKWSLKQGGQIESPDDPNTPYGFAAGQISGRTYTVECDPKRTLVAVRNILTEIGAFSQYPGGLLFPAPNGNRVSITLPLLQPISTAPGKAGNLRNETNQYQTLPGTRDGANRDGDVILCFS